MARKIRMLFVEDDPSSVEFMIHAMRASGYDPDWVRVDNSHDFEVALHNQPDVIIADYYVPDFYGIDVLYMMHRLQIDIPVVVVSGGLPGGSELQMIRLGAADYVRKDELGRLGKAVYDATVRVRASCRVSDGPRDLAVSRGAA